MKNFKKQLEKDLSEVVEDIRFYDVRQMHAEACQAEAKAEAIKEQLTTLEGIISAGEGNLLLFNSDGSFTLWCIRIPEGGEQIIEKYNVDLTFRDYEELLETADCIDYTELFDTAKIAHLVVVTDNISDSMRRDVYYFVSNETIESIILESA